MLSISPTQDFRIVRSRDGSRTLWNRRYAQTYKSTAGAATESRHVYLQGTGVAQRLIDGQSTRIFEVGFGTGLNFLISADTALRHRTPLHYVSNDVRLLPVRVLKELDHGALLSSVPLYQMFIAAYAKERWSTRHTSWTFRFPPYITLQLHIGDLVVTSAKEAAVVSKDFDAIYQDAFSPWENPELWTEEFMIFLANKLKPGGRLASYCVQGTVRRRLEKAGFIVHRVPGPKGGKREVLVAERR